MRRSAPHRRRRTAHHVVLAVLALALTLPGFGGRAGVQVVDQATLARVAALHLHGVPGERQYVDRHHAPAPFVPGHCHAAPDLATNHPDPEEALAAGSLAGSVLCAAVTATVAAPEAGVLGAAFAVPTLVGRSEPPRVPPPQG